MSHVKQYIYYTNLQTIHNLQARWQHKLTNIMTALLASSSWLKKHQAKKTHRRDRTCLQHVQAVSVYQFPDNFAFLQLNGQLLFFSYLKQTGGSVTGS